MKNILLTTLLLGAGTCLSQAAIELNFYNSYDLNESSITFKNNAGTAFAGPGVVAVGWFDEDPNFTQELSIRDQFKSFWTWNAATEAGSGYTYFNSVNDFAVAGTADGFGSAEGKKLYAFVGSGTSVSASNEFAVLSFKSAEDEALSLTSAQFPSDLALADNDWLSDNEFATWVLELGSVQGTDTILFAAIPEPSVFGLFAGLCALSFVASRRTKKH